MESRRTQAQQVLRTFLERTDRDAAFEDATPLQGEGLALDSLETAELSALLEDELGTDPFTEGLLPVTVGELLDFYDESASVGS
ncbi:MAG TPA: hypothetical protein VFK34_07205 [Marmoricola sp.]|jgi:acyl carrier protein|nr:hypothetical protein [Marmoricola sp.]